jgi:hypothetical protein
MIDIGIMKLIREGQIKAHPGIFIASGQIR